jgi:hypothetical protein
MHPLGVRIMMKVPTLRAAAIAAGGAAVVIAVIYAPIPAGDAPGRCYLDPVFGACPLTLDMPGR